MLPAKRTTALRSTRTATNRRTHTADICDGSTATHRLDGLGNSPAPCVVRPLLIEDVLEGIVFGSNDRHHWDTGGYREKAVGLVELTIVREEGENIIHGQARKRG